MKRHHVFLLIGFAFISAVFVKLFGIGNGIPNLSSELLSNLLAGIALCGLFGLLIEYGWSIRKTPYFLIPILLACSPMAKLMDALYFRWVGTIPDILASLFYPVTAAIFLYQGIRMLKKQRTPAIHFMIVGVLGFLIYLYEFSRLKYGNFWFKEALPDFVLNNIIIFRDIHLALLLELIFIDVFLRLGDKGMKVEQQILRAGLIFMTVKFFVDFLFV